MPDPRVVTKFVNLTQHDIHVYVDHASLLVVPSESRMARCAMATLDKGILQYGRHRIPCISTETSEPMGIPAPEPGVIYIVSNIVLSSMKTRRDDVVAPDTTSRSVVKSDDGKILGVRRFRT